MTKERASLLSFASWVMCSVCGAKFRPHVVRCPACGRKAGL